MPVEAQKTYGTQNRLDRKRNTPSHIINKTQNKQNKERILKKYCKGKNQVTYKDGSIIIKPDFVNGDDKSRRA